jgi:SRSO17 transposase
MDLLAGITSAARFEVFVSSLAGVLGHADRARPMRDYTLGLLMPGERKSVEPMAAVTAPSRVAAQHQSLLHFVGEAPWSDAAVLAKVCELVLPAIERHGPIEAWILDDTGFPKKGRHSVGVTRQYCGQLGKQDNCQIAVSLSVANHAASLPVACRLYLPQDWADDADRRKCAKVPADVTFKTKPQIALDQIKAALARGISAGIVLMDAGYGADTELRDGITAQGLIYAAGILPNTTVWPPGMAPLPPKEWSGRGRRPTLLQRSDEHQPVSVKVLALSLPPSAWRTISWREGTNDTLTSRFARLRVRPAHRDYNRTEARPEEWLLVEWPEGEAEPTKYFFSTLPEDTPFEHLVDFTKMRWRIERDYQDLKQEVGLGHYEGRGWRGFHHHLTLCIAAYGFLISERETIPPSAAAVRKSLQGPAIPQSYRPRGAPDPARAPHPQLDRDDATATHRRPGEKPPTMSMLQRSQ